MTESLLVTPASSISSQPRLAVFVGPDFLVSGSLQMLLWLVPCLQSLLGVIEMKSVHVVLTNTFVSDQGRDSGMFCYRPVEVHDT